MIESATVRDALLLRTHALALLSGAIDADTFVRATAAFSAATWRFFLAAEACATPLRQRLGNAGQSLRPDSVSLLERASAAELQRMLAAQLQLSLIDRAATMSDTSPILLKGGVPIAEGRHAFDLGDIDLLVAHAQVERLTATLVALGADATDTLRFAGTLTTEIHSKLDAGPGVAAAVDHASEPLPRFSHLRRLQRVQHAAYIIQHCTTHHVERRGSLRDLMLLADVLADFTAEELKHLHAIFRPSHDRALYERFLNRAVAVVRQQGVTDDSETALVMAAHYALGERWPKDTGFVPHTLRLMTMWFVGAPRDVGRGLRAYLFNPVRDESRWLAHPFVKYAPRFWRTVSYVIRTPYRLALLTYAAAVAIRFRLDFDRP